MKQGIVITGASGGIGRALARLIASDLSPSLAHGQNNDKLLLLHGNRRSQELNALTEELSNRVAVETFFADLTDEAEQDQLVDRIFESLDVHQASLHSWIHAAGIDLPAMNRSYSFDERLRAILAVDVVAPVRMSRRIAEFLERYSDFSPADESVGQTTPHLPLILFVGWSGAFRGEPGETSQLYALAKGAIIAYSKSLATELAPRARVCCVSPGWIRTTWGENAPQRFDERIKRETLLQRWGRPEEVASVILFLMSDQASYLNAQNIEIDGGLR